MMPAATVATTVMTPFNMIYTLLMMIVITIAAVMTVPMNHNIMHCNNNSNEHNFSEWALRATPWVAGCRVRLYCKGADSMIYARLAPGQAVEQASQPHLADMARQGLRTLCLGQRDIPDKEYQLWSSAYHEASVALQGREEAVGAQAEAIEKGLTLLGATGVEDRLQEGVPQALSTLSAAGIKVSPTLTLIFVCFSLSSVGHLPFL